MPEARPGELAVVIPVYGNRGHLQDIIDALDRQAVAIQEVIISHSGDGDPTGSLHSTRTPISYLHSQQQLNSGAARNRGARASSAPWLAFLDDDVIPHDNWSEAVVEQLASDEGRSCFVGSIGVDVSGGYWGMCMWFLEFGSVHPGLPAGAIDGGASANMFMHRSLFSECGGFPEEVSRCVDVEFMANCRRLGGYTGFVPSAQVSHRNIGGFRYCWRHAISQGMGSARVRQVTPLQGGRLAHIPLLSLGLYPFRLALMTFRIFRWGRRSRLSFLYHLAGIAILLSAWNLGFYRQAKSGRKRPF